MGPSGRQYEFQGPDQFCWTKIRTDQDEKDIDFIFDLDVQKMCVFTVLFTVFTVFCGDATTQQFDETLWFGENNLRRIKGSLNIRCAFRPTWYDVRLKKGTVRRR